MVQSSNYYLELSGVPSNSEMPRVAEKVFPLVFRRDFSAPGAALISLGCGVTSTELRAFMVALKHALDVPYHRLTARHLAYLSMARFDQQVTTKFHLDGSPDEAYLMLGYEPSEVPSTLAVADSTRAAFDWGIEPKTLLADQNPMYPGHEGKLIPYVTRLDRFDPSASQVLLINNSSLAYREGGGNVLGVRHQATILNPMPGVRRVVNSTMIVPEADVVPTPGEDVERTFVKTDKIAGDLATSGLYNIDHPPGMSRTPTKESV